jgi:tetratricopeptide (TPR) repeat protein
VSVPGALDRFELQRQIGSGGMATIYRAVDRETGGVVALKILHGRSSEQTERFRQEAEVLAELTHPAVVRYIAHGTTPLDEHYLAMEWLEGETLDDRLARGALTIGESVDLGRRIADVLASAHRRGIVHRDIKPSNLFLVNCSLAELKVLDFGLARRVLDPKRLTQAGGIMGTPMYMAPEQARGDALIDPRADVFSLGCVLFECLTGHPPFTGPTAMAVLAKICLAESLPLRELCAGLPRELEATLGRMLAKERSGRPPDGSAVEVALGAVSEDLERSSTNPSGRVATELLRPARDTLTSGEQRVICVVLVTRPNEPGDAATAPPRDLPNDDTIILPASAAFDQTGGEGLRQALEPYGARLDRLLDGSMVVTLSGRGAPTDQAAHAARCALHLRAALPQAAMTISTGRAVIFGQLPVGDVIDRGAELLKGEPRGVIRLDEVTADLLGSRFELTAEPGRRYLLAEQAFDEGPRTLLGRSTICVGRERELALLEGTFVECVEEPVARAVLVTAPAGGGKSRLRHELGERLRRRGDAFEILLGRGDAIAAGSPFGLLAPAIRGAAGIASGDAPPLRQKKLKALVGRHVPLEAARRVSEFLGELTGIPFEDDPGPALHAARKDPRLMGDQMRSAWLDWLSAECAHHPVLLVLEDVQWGDRPSVQFVDAALRALRERPLMVLALARPEVDEQFPDLWDGRDLQRVTLRALTRKACQNLAGQILGEALAPAVQDWLVERADGNPFYLEELIRAVASGSRTALPETVVGMVQARLDALGSDAKRVLRAASIFGLGFRQGGVSALISDRDRLGLATCLDVLVTREVVVPKGGGKDEYLFRHALLRDAAYAMLTEGDRGLGHLLAGEWLEKSDDRDAIVLVEHFERGGDPLRAAQWCRQAAEEALAGNDLPGAVARADRGVQLGASGANLGALRLVQAQAYFWRGKYAQAEAAAAAAIDHVVAGSVAWFQGLGELVSSLGQQGRYPEVARWADTAGSALGDADASNAQLACLIRAAGYLLAGGRYETTDAILARVGSASAAFTNLEPALAAKVAAVRAARNLHSGDQSAAIGLQEAALEEAAAAGDTRTMCEMRANLASVWADIGQLARAETLLRESLAEAQKLELHYVTALVLINLGPVLAYSGRLGEARRLAMQALNFARKQGDQRWEGAAQLYLSTITHLSGEHQGSEQRARRASEIVPDPLRPSALAAIARAVLAQGRSEEALEHARAAHQLMEAVGHVEEYESLVRLMLALALEANGDHTGARAALRAAVDRLQARADHISNPEWRASFLTQLPDNARTVALAREWGIGESRPALP